MGYDIGADQLLLHTIQTEAAFEALLSHGVLEPDIALAEPDFADAYAWMLRQMAARLGTQGDGALWFWARIRREDLLESCRLSRGEVLLTCRVPRERVMLSNFGDWHSVLNACPFVPDLPGESDDAFSARIDKVLEDFYDRLKAAGARDAGISGWPGHLRAEAERSWEFALEPANYGRFEAWQGTMHRLHLEDVVEAVRIES
ncbi:DUF3841 domain-containing protein [Arthrobacter sp. NPDC058097]|uniref:DUF3841 domain-containing protein n=1 Tax=Arthrobacter sp. NPDC058097 TaxID=3346340 RepID=UPI0036DC05E4